METKLEINGDKHRHSQQLSYSVVDFVVVAVFVTIDQLAAAAMINLLEELLHDNAGYLSDEASSNNNNNQQSTNDRDDCLVHGR
jgi:hypothetical protein